MFLYYCVDGDPATLRPEALLRGGAYVLYTALEDAHAACEGALLVVDADRLDRERAAGRDTLRVSSISPEAVCNLDPYLPPEPVVAGGGVVVRPGAGAPEVLLIFRKGVWDLPKGKQDAGETIEACARREVCEEIGVDEVTLGRKLGTTLHGYPRDGAYHVKTTHWYLMRTAATTFEPEEREGIENVAWVPWPEAVRTVGFETLRRHLQAVEPFVREALASTPGAPSRENVSEKG